MVAIRMPLGPFYKELQIYKIIKNVTDKVFTINIKNVSVNIFTKRCESDILETQTMHKTYSGPLEGKSVRYLEQVV